MCIGYKEMCIGHEDCVLDPQMYVGKTSKCFEHARRGIYFPQKLRLCLQHARRGFNFPQKVYSASLTCPQGLLVSSKSVHRVFKPSFWAGPGQIWARACLGGSAGTLFEHICRKGCQK